MFRPKRLYAVTLKEFIQIYRDPRSLAMVILLPVLLIVLFGYAVTFDIKHVSMAVFDQDRTQRSRDFMQFFANSQYFSVHSYRDNYQEIIDDIDAGRIKFGLVIPARFSRSLSSGQEVPVQVLLDGSDPNTANIVLSYVNGITEIFNATIRGDKIPVTARVRVWFNEEMESKNSIVPGLIAVIMTVIGALLTSLTVAREWERGTMEGLISTPVKKLELILGKLIPYFVLGMVDMFIAVAASRLIFDVPLRGSFAALVFISGIFMIGSIAFGFFLSVIAKNQHMANQLAIFTTFLPAFLLSGFLFPIANMPALLQIITQVVPARHFVAALRAIYLKGLGLDLLWMQTVILAIIGLVGIAAAYMKFKKFLE
ncbi:MAG: ABC transporter permease [Desulfovibrionales bacterium]|nr:ABC transporter permease [Desulfovibrionales bacterium]